MTLQAKRSTSRFGPPAFVCWLLVPALCIPLGAAAGEPESPGQLIPMFRLPMDDTALRRNVNLALKIVTRSPGSEVFKGEEMRQTLSVKFNGRDSGQLSLTPPWSLYFSKDYAGIAARSSITFFLNEGLGATATMDGLKPMDRVVVTTKSYWGSEAVVEMPNANSLLIKPGASRPDTLIDEHIEFGKWRVDGSGVRVLLRGVHVTWSGVMSLDVLRGPGLDLSLLDLYVEIELANPSEREICLGAAMLSPDCWVIMSHDKTDRRDTKWQAMVSIKHEDEGILRIPSFARVCVAIPLPDDLITRAFEKGDEVNVLYAGSRELRVHLRRLGDRIVEVVHKEM